MLDGQKFRSLGTGVVINQLMPDRSVDYRGAVPRVRALAPFRLPNMTPIRLDAADIYRASVRADRDWSQIH